MSIAMVVAMTAALCCTASADESAEATLIINRPDWSPFTSETVNVTGNGTYTITATTDEATTLCEFNALHITNGEEIFGHTYFVTIDSIEVDGVAVELQGDSYTCSADGEGVTTRVNIFNKYNNPDDLNVVNEKKGYSDARVPEISGKETARLLPDEYISGGDIGGTTTLSSVKVTFTVSGVAAATADTAPIFYLAAIVGLAGIAMVASKKRA